LLLFDYLDYRITLFKMSNQQKKSKWGGARQHSGPKPLRAADRKQALVMVRLTVRQLQIIRGAAEQAGMNFADWLREALLARASPVNRVLKSKRPKGGQAKNRRPSA
jgi:hypothetical protein